MSSMTFEMTFHGPFRIATGLATSEHDVAGDHVEPIPASSLKGVTRHAAEELLGLPELVLEMLFGSPARPSPWSWSAVEFPEPIRFESRARVSIDERTRTAREGALVFGEDMWATTARFRITRVDVASPEIEEVLGLVAAVTAVQSFGGDRRRGMGWVTIRLIETEGIGLDPDSVDLAHRAAEAVCNLRRRAVGEVGHASAGRASVRSPRVWIPENLSTSPDVHELRLEALSLAFVSVGSGPQVGNHRGASLSIPGSTLRGAFAGLWLTDHPTRSGDDAEFQELFFGAVRWPTLHPFGASVVPLSVRRCKYRPEPTCAHEFHDGAFEEAESDGLSRSECGVCGGPLELSKGEVVALGVPGAVRSTTRMSVQLDASETAVEGALFSRDGFEAGAQLQGSASLCSQSISEGARHWLESLGGGRTIRVGGRRSVAGELTITASSVSTSSVSAVDAGTRLALRVAQPVVLLDRFGAPSTEVRDLIVASALPVSPVRDRQFLRTAAHGGWNALAGVPKSVDTALITGSTVVVESVEAISASQVARLLRAGIGPRASEGFGAVTVDTQAWTPTTAAGSETGGQP